MGKCAGLLLIEKTWREILVNMRILGSMLTHFSDADEVIAAVASSIHSLSRLPSPNTSARLVQKVPVAMWL